MVTMCSTPSGRYAEACLPAAAKPALIRSETSSTDVCVLSTMLGAIDWGFRVILVQDALCSSADETHDAMMNIYMNWFGEQVETVTTETLLECW